MREKTFRKPTLRHCLLAGGVKKIPRRISPEYTNQLHTRGIMLFAGDTYSQAVDTIENLAEGKFAFLLPKFAVSGEQSNRGIKSLDSLVKIDSQPVLRELSHSGEVPERLTAEFLQQNRIWPYDLIKTAMQKADVEHPPMGFYWVGQDNRIRATTWIRSTAGAEMMQMQLRKAKTFGKALDKTTYARTLRVGVKSRTESGVVYEFTLTGLPMHRRGDVSQYSDWINVAHDSADPDASYRGEAHEQRRFPVCFWSSSTIFAYFEAMKFVSKHKEWKQFRINPFPIPADKPSVDYIDNLRLKTFILEYDTGRTTARVLNKSEIDLLIGARTVLRKYDNWYHWNKAGKRDISYLYQRAR